MANLSRTLIAAVVIVIVLVAGVVYYVSLPRPSTATTVSTSATSSGIPAEISVDESSPPGTMDAAGAQDNNALEVVQNDLLPLVFCTNELCAQYEPVLASSWTASSDGLTYTFYLRHGVYYSNGDPFNAYVVWYNVYRDLIMNQPIDFIFFEYLNASGVTAKDLNALNNPQNTPDATLLQLMQNPNNSVTVLNETTVQFHLTNPFVAFLKTIDTSPWVFVDPYIVSQHGGVATNQPNSYMVVNGTLVGDGPYVTQTYVPNQYAILVANPNYWAQNLTASDTNFVLQPAKIPKVVINYKGDELTRTLDIETNKAQAAIVAFNDVPSVLKNDQNLYIPDLGPSGSLEWVGIDAQKFPTNNPLVRQAIVEAVNVSEIDQVAFSGYAMPVLGPDLHGFFGYNDSIKPPPYDPADAKRLLAEAGFPGGKGLPPLNFVYATGAYTTLIAQVLQQDLAQVGITLVPQGMSTQAWIEEAYLPGNSTQAPYMQANNWTYYNDVSAYIAVTDANFGVIESFHNQTIVNLMLKSNSELDPQKRAQEISQFTQMLENSHAFIWTSQDLDLYDTGAGAGPTVFNKCLSGMFYNTAFNGVMFNVVYYTCAPS